MSRQALVPVLFAGCAIAAVLVPMLKGPAQAAPEAVLTEAVLTEAVLSEDLEVASVDGPAVLDFRGRLDRTAVHPSDNNRVRMELVISSVDEPSGARMPTDLLVVMDHSGSMSGQKLYHAKAATQQLINQLGPEDRFGLVTYASGTQLLLPMATVQRDRSGLLKTVENIRSGGGTAMVEGMAHGLEVMGARTQGRAGRVVVISDGQPNGGASVHSTLIGQAQQSAYREVPLTAVGVGDDFDESLMTAIADAGTGNYHYLQDGADLAQVFADELSTTAETVANSLTVTLPMAPGVTVVDAAGYPLSADRSGATSFNIGSLYAGQERRIWVTFEIAQGDAGEVALPVAQLRYTAEEQPGVAALAVGAVRRELSEAAWLASIDQEAWSASVVTEEYNGLRQQVATAVKLGDRAAAQLAIDAYRARNYSMNEVVQSASVADNLGELDVLEQQMADTFEGANQSAKQNVYSKSTGSSAYYGRRGGQAKGK